MSIRLHYLDGIVGGAISPEDVLDLVRNMVAPNTWIEMGGNAAITLFKKDSRDVLIVRQEDTVQQLIADFLAELR